MVCFEFYFFFKYPEFEIGFFVTNTCLFESVKLNTVFETIFFISFHQHIMIRMFIYVNYSLFKCKNDSQFIQKVKSNFSITL